MTEFSKIHHFAYQKQLQANFDFGSNLSQQIPLNVRQKRNINILVIKIIVDRRLVFALLFVLILVYVGYCFGYCLGF